eukprot:GHVR01159669.1.p1 GENE.GHVR01159669.1~~GHVR01159669.1.p1  ORF type:complete len:311 (+),score=19.68 GHVR01159669.1:320-1252(+)
MFFIKLYKNLFRDSSMNKKNIGYDKLFNHNNITPGFQRLFEILKVPEVPNNLEDAFNLVQGRSHQDYTWLRTGERYDSQSDPLITDEQADSVIDFCKAIGFFNDIATPSNIDGILVMGSTLQRMRAQVQVLNQSIEINPSLSDFPVYFVGGERMLSKEIGETQQNLYHPGNESTIIKKRYSNNNQPEINDERDMIRLVVKQSLSDKFQHINFVMAPKKEGAARATTMDGMKLWFNNYNPPAGHFAIVSSNPFILYQQLVATHSALIFNRPDIHFSGYGTSYIIQKGKPDTAGILLDNFARIIYEIQRIIK